jgi:beta-glucanase (GH16 family)
MIRLRRRTPRRLAGNVAVVALGGAALTGALTGYPAALHAAGHPGTAHRDAKSAWSQTYSDNFSGPGKLSTWIIEKGNDQGWGHRQLQYYTSAATNVATGRSGLVMTATKTGAAVHHCWYGPCRYTSARLQTNFAGGFYQEYGLIEARIKVPDYPGIWPAFWLYSSRPRAEIDVIETNGKRPYLVEGFAHAPNVNFHSAFKKLSHPLAAGFHTYAISWTPTSITWLVDGKAYGKLTKGAAEFRHPLYLILQLAVGGTWAGKPPSSTHFPVKMTVRWVKAYRRS